MALRRGTPRVSLHPRIKVLGSLVIFTFLLYFLTPWDTVDHRDTVLVTGGLGFIGSTLVEELLEEGYNVVILDDESTGHNINPIATKILGDITVVSDFSAIDEQIDYVIHYAAAISVPESIKNPAKYEKINLAGSRNVFKWAVKHKVKRVVAASSAAVYGVPQVIQVLQNLIHKELPLTEDSPKNPISPYAFTKLEMEHSMQQYQKLFNKTDFIALRFFNVYGPRQDPKSPYSGVVSKFLERAHTGEPILINGDGSNTRDLVYVQDVAKATILAMQKGTGFQVYNVGTQTRVTLNELAQNIIQVVGSESTVEYVEERPGDIAHSYSDASKIERDLGWTAKVPLDQGLARTYHWYKLTLDV